MSKQSIRELMVPLSNCATVPQEASLCDAVTALREAQESYDQGKYPHRAILIVDEHNDVVGKVNLTAILKALEPKYGEMLSDDSPSHYGFSTEFQKQIYESFNLWDSSLDELCATAASLKIKTFMFEVKKDGQIDVDASIELAIHQLVLGQLQSLLVTENNRTVGLLRLTDVFECVAESIMACDTSETKIKITGAEKGV